MTDSKKEHINTSVEPEVPVEDFLVAKKLIQTKPENNFEMPENLKGNLSKSKDNSFTKEQLEKHSGMKKPKK